MTSFFSSIDGGGNPAYENLSSYFLGGATRARAAPSGVPSKRARDPREASKPGQQPSNGRTPIPTSSQKPGNREGNQRVPYARMMFTDMEDAAAPRELQPGDAVFVHKTSQSMGHGHNRTIKSTGISQLNAMLKKSVPGVTTMDPSNDPGLQARVLRVRYEDAQNARKAAEHELQHEQYRKGQYFSSDVTVKNRIRGLKKKVTAAADKEDDLRKKIKKNLYDPNFEFNVNTDWRAIKMLTEWTLDGVLINADDEVEADDTNQPKLSRDDGVLLNVCVQGPTPMRNTAWQLKGNLEAHAWAPQFIDPRMAVMEKVFVGLFTEKRTGDAKQDNNERSWTGFYFRLFTGTQAIGAGGRTAGPAPHKHGPSETDFGKLLGAWRVGSVMDNRLTTDTDNRILLNVCVEWWSTTRLRDEYDCGIGREGEDFPICGDSELEDFSDEDDEDVPDGLDDVRVRPEDRRLLSTTLAPAPGSSALPTNEG